MRELCKTYFPQELREAEVASTDSVAQSAGSTDLSLVDREGEEQKAEQA